MRDNFGSAYHFDIKKFRYGKVIAFVDSDIDGWNMLSLLSATMLWCYPEVVAEGRFYRTQAPLYLINDKKHPYVTSKTEYFKLYTEKFVKNIQLIDSLGHMLTTAEMRDLISKNMLYLDEIKSLQKYFYVDSEIFEFLIAHRKDRGIIGKFMKKFPESEYDKEIKLLSTVFKESRMTITINDNFFDKCKRLDHMINEVNNSRIYYQVIDKNVTLDGVYSLGSVFKLSEKYLPDVIERIKGVGELPPDVIWETVLNPQSRQLIRLTAEDIKRELDVVHVLHGPDPSLRKDFMKGYQFTKDILDT
jgi:DNA gyrase subunit B